MGWPNRHIYELGVGNGSFAASPVRARPRGFSGIANGDTLLKSDKCTLVLEATKDGKIRLQNSALHEGIVLLPDQVLEVRWQGGQVHLMRAKRPDELETDPEGWKEAGYV